MPGLSLESRPLPYRRVLVCNDTHRPKGLCTLCQQFCALVYMYNLSKTAVMVPLPTFYLSHITHELCSKYFADDPTRMLEHLRLFERYRGENESIARLQGIRKHNTALTPYYRTYT